MDSGQARVTAVSGNMVTISSNGPIMQNGLASVNIGEASLKGEVIRVRGDSADLQVFEDTTGIRAGDTVQVFQEMFSVELGSGLLGMVYDGLQNPLFRLAEEIGFFLERGKYIDALDREREWFFEPSVSSGDEVTAGETLGTVKEYTGPQNLNHYLSYIFAIIFP